MAKFRAVSATLAGVIALGGLAACSANADDPILVSGSSTVYPITNQVARENRVTLEMEAEGTLDGFERFCNGETHINNASEAIPGAGQPTDYMAMCEENGVEYIELPIGLDALSVVRNNANTFATDLTVEELRRIWEPNSSVTTWADVREGFPDEEIVLVGRPEGSGTFDYFTSQITGAAGEIRDDYRSTDDLEELATWIADDQYALGFMGVGNYLHTDEDYLSKMSTVSVDGVEPSLANAQSGTYHPLTRPLFIYVSVAALEERDDVLSFVETYVDDAAGILPRVFFYPLEREDYTLVKERLDNRTTGTLFDGDPHQDVNISELLAG